MKRRAINEGRVYLRRSSSKQESSLATQLEWAIEKARTLRVPLRATLADLYHMQANHLVAYRDIFLDDATSGSMTRRPAFDALLEEVRTNLNVSHVFAFKRDRLGRPRDPLDMVVVERDIRSWGVRVEMSDGVIDPAEHGAAVVGQTAMSLFGYHESGEFSKKLSERVVLVQTSLARKGYSTGGRPPYGYGRFLVDATGRVLEELQPGRKVKEAGCHVEFIEKDETKIGVWVNILEWLEADWGYKRVADHLNNLGIPAPDAGHVRGGHLFGGEVSGKWNHTTVRALARNPLITGVKEYGRFSQGMHHRVGLNGPRAVDDDELLDDGAGRIVENQPELWIRAESGGRVFFDPERWQRLQAKLEERGCAQRGKRRAPDATAYPLAARVFDMTDGCGSIMQGAVRKDRGGGRPLYRCGIYMKRRGACHHNAVDAEALLKFTVRTLARIVKTIGGRAKLEAAIRKRIQSLAAAPRSPEQAILDALRAKVERLRRQVEQAPRRILEEEDDVMRAQMRAASRELAAELTEAESRLAEISARNPSSAPLDIEAEVRKAMELLDRIESVCGDTVARGEVPRLLEDLGARIGLTFRAGAVNRRAVRVLQGGVVAFGNRMLPCTLRTSGGRPLVGGLPPEDSNHDRCSDHSGCRECGDHQEHFGKALSPADGKTAPSRRRGTSTQAKVPSRGGGTKRQVDSKNPRQPSRTDRLSKGSSGGRT